MIKPTKHVPDFSILLVCILKPDFKIGEHLGTHLIWTCTGRQLRWTILIGPQIIFNIENLINTIFEPITNVHLSKCSGTHLNKCVPKNSPSKYHTTHNHSNHFIID
jgi:hypothetical protein